MKKRPEIRVGDVVRMSKRGRNRTVIYRSKTMVVRKVSGDGTDGHTRVSVYFVRRGRKVGALLTFKRRDLWRTGYNVLDNGKEFEVKKDSFTFRVPPEPVEQPAPIELEKVEEPIVSQDRCHKCGGSVKKGGTCYWCGAQN